MACNRETSADGSTSSASPVRQTPDSLVPCCNNNCHFFGCAATMNLCSKCYSEHIVKEGGAFLNKPCDAADHSPVVRSIVDGADEATNPHSGGDADGSIQRVEDESASGSSAVDTTSSDAPGLREILRSKDISSLRTNMMNRSTGVSDLHAVFRSVETSSSVVDMSARQQQIPSPLSLSSSGFPQVFSPLVRQVEAKLSLPPLPRQQAVNRCLACRKRVGLLGFKCKCGDIFCALHRYSDKHDCSFDYKAAGRAAIARENPIVKASKIEKI